MSEEKKTAPAVEERKQLRMTDWEKRIDWMDRLSMLIGLAAIVIGTASIILSLR